MHYYISRNDVDLMKIKVDSFVIECKEDKIKIITAVIIRRFNFVVEEFDEDPRKRRSLFADPWESKILLNAAAFRVL